MVRHLKKKSINEPLEKVLFFCFLSRNTFQRNMYLFLYYNLGIHSSNKNVEEWRGSKIIYCKNIILHQNHSKKE